jgi:hypothetical protein
MNATAAPALSQSWASASFPNADLYRIGETLTRSKTTSAELSSVVRGKLLLALRLCALRQVEYATQLRAVL